jgi:hypothetical protein
MSYAVKQATATSFFVTMYATDGFTRVLGATLGQVIVKAYYADGTTAVVTPTSWVEKSATDAPGVYMLTLPGSAFPAIPGPVLFSIFTSASDKSYREFIIQQYIPDDTSALVVRMATNVLVTRQIIEGHWKINPSTNTLTLYAPDDTVLQILDLTDRFGAPTSTQIFERRPRTDAYPIPTAP